MKVVCDRSCQVRISGKIKTVEYGEILDLDVEECPEHFHEIGKSRSKDDLYPDFENTSDAELIEMDGDVEELKTHIEANYPEISFGPTIGWPKLVQRYIQARNTRVTKIDNTGKVKNTIVNVTRALEVEDQATVEDEERVHPDEESMSDEDFSDIDDLLKED